MTLTLALISCTSLPRESEPQVPDPIAEDGTILVTYDPETETVSMPLWYWKKIVRYIIDVSE